MILNVVAFAAAGLLGQNYARRALRRVLDSKTDRLARPVFAVWLLIYAIVGAQMSWILRPFVGDPAQPVELFRETESNFLNGLLDALK